MSSVSAEGDGGACACAGRAIAKKDRTHADLRLRIGKFLEGAWLSLCRGADFQLELEPVDTPPCLFEMLALLVLVHEPLVIRQSFGLLIGLFEGFR